MSLQMACFSPFVRIKSMLILHNFTYILHVHRHACLHTYGWMHTMTWQSMPHRNITRYALENMIQTFVFMFYDTNVCKHAIANGGKPDDWVAAYNGSVCAGGEVATGCSAARGGYTSVLAHGVKTENDHKANRYVVLPALNADMCVCSRSGLAQNSREICCGG